MRMRSAAIVMLCVSLALATIASAKTKDQPWTPGQVLVKYKAGFAPEIGKHGVKKAKKVFGKFKRKGKAQEHAAARGLDRVYLLEVGANEVKAVVAALSKDPNVEYAEPNWRLTFPAVPNDPSYGVQWGLDKIGAPAAWDSATSGTGVVVGVVDTGIDVTHPDLAANLWTNPGEIAGNNVDDDGNGFIDDVHGWNFQADNNNVADTNGHGTRVAGVIGAVGNNATGVAGVAWTAKLAALSIGSTPDVYAAVQAIEYANMMGFRITNNSYGWSEGGQAFLFDEVVAAAEAAGYLFVAAAGNDAKDNDQLPMYPSHYENSNVIAVTATTQTDGLASFANWGARSVDMGAPGVAIDSTTPGGTYGSAQGTSLSAPFVTGAAALYWTANPTATHVQVRDELLFTAQPVAALHGKSVTGGRLSLSNLFDAETNAPAAITDLTVTDSTFRSVFVRFTATGDDGAAGSATRYDVRVSTSPITEANFASAYALSGEPIPQAAGTLESFKLSGLDSSTTYYIAVRAYDNAGNGSALSNVATFTTGRAAVLFDDNVEGGPRNWTIEGANGIGGPALWRHFAAYNETHIWSYSKPVQFGTDYDTGARNWGALIMPEIDLAQARDARLRFRQYVWTDRTFGKELASVQISVDGGAWTPLMEKMFTLYEYLGESIDLSAYDGQRIRLRFFFDTIDAIDNDNPGWHIDDFIVDASSTNAPPVANINGPYSVTEDSAATLSSAGSSDPEGAALEYKWDFGDGSFAYTTSTSVTHTWTQPGSYTVTLTAYDGQNSSDVATTVVSPAPVNDRPIAVIEAGFAPAPHNEETAYFFPYYGSSDEEGSPLTCRFDYGDGTPVTTRPCEPGSWSHTWNRPGSYTITLIVNDGELDSLPATHTINVLETTNDRPIAVAGGPYDGSVNQAVTLDGTASSDEETSIASYLWTFHDGTTSTAAQPVKTFTAAGTFNVTLVVTDQTGLTSTSVTAQVRICGGANVNVFAGTKYACTGQPVTLGLNVSSGVLPLTVTWSDGHVQEITSLSNGYYAERVVTMNGAATYSLTSVTDFLGCAGTVGSGTIDVVAPSGSLSGTTTNCAGAQRSITPTLTGDYPWTLTWSDGHVQTVPNGASRTRTVSPTETTTYSIVSATSASCGATPVTVSGSYTARVIEPPVAVLSGGGTSCSGSFVPLTVSITGGEAPYYVTFSDGAMMSSPNATFNRLVAPSSPTTYTITRVESGSCVGTASGSATVTQGTRPSATVSGGGSYCAGSGGSATISAALTGVGPWTLTWSDGATQTVETSPATRVVSPTSSTTYSVTTVTANGCSATGSGNASVSVLQQPSAVVTGGGLSCNLAPVTIRATVSAGSFPFQITWSDGVTQTLTSSNVATRSVAPETTTVYTVTSVVAGNGCSGTTSGSATVTAATRPTATVSGGGNFCAGSAGATITATLTGTAPFSLTWSDGVTQTIESGNVATRTVAPASSQTYSVTSVSSLGCTGTASGSATATRVALPTATVSGGGLSCGLSPVTITASLTGSAPFVVTWSDGVSQTVSSGTTASRQVSPATTTVYTVSSITGNGCSGSSSGSATVTAVPAPTATVSGGGNFCEGSAGVTITAALTGNAPFTVTWSDGVTQNISSGNTASRTVAPASATTYTVTSISGGGCTGTASGSATATPVALPTATVSGGGLSCDAAPVTITAALTGSAPFEITWSDGVTQTVSSGNSASRQVSPAATTVYTISSITGNGCSGSASGSATVTVVAAPTATVSGGGTFCEGSAGVTITATLTGEGPFSVTWSDGVTQNVSSGNTASRTVAPASATTYSVTAISANGCSGTSSGSATATPLTLPAATVSGGGLSCDSAPVTITASLTGNGPFIVTWSDGVTQTIESGNTASRSVSPASTTTYTVTGISANGCSGSSSGSATVTVVASPTATVSGGGTFCEGSAGVTITAALTGSAPFTVTWSDGVTQTISSGNTASRTVAPATATTYTVTSITGAGCTGTSSGSATATPLALPTATVSGGGSFCEGSAGVTITAVLTGNAPFVVTWSDGVTQTISSGNTASRTVAPASATTYTVTSITGAGCTGTSSGSATATPLVLPTATVSGGGLSCAGAAVTITASLTGDGPFIVTWSDGVSQTISSGNIASRSVAPASTTTYTVTGVSANGCTGSSSGSATVTAVAAPTATVSGGGSFCAGSAGVTITAALTGSAPFVVTWSDGVTQNISSGTTASRTVAPASATTYTVTSITGAGCSGTSSGSATATPLVLPTATVSGGGNSCGGAAVAITATLTGNGPFTIVWSDGVSQTINSGNTATRNVAPASATTYTVTSVTANGCSGSSSGSATVSPVATPTATVSGGGSYCPGSAGTTITAALTGSAPFVVTWSDGVTQNVSSGNTASRQVTPAATTTYTVTAITGAGCSGTSSGSATVTRRTLPTATVSGGGTFCEGSAGVSITATLTGTAPFSVTWSDGVTQTISSGTTASRTVAPGASTTYTVTTISDAYCTGTSSGSAVANPTLRPVITVQPSSPPIPKNTSTTISVTTTESGLNYQWYQGPSGTTTTPVGTNSSSFTTPKLRSTTQYWVKIWKTGCASYPTNSQTATITVQ